MKNACECVGLVKNTVFTYVNSKQILIQTHGNMSELSKDLSAYNCLVYILIIFKVR